MTLVMSPVQRQVAVSSRVLTGAWNIPKLLMLRFVTANAPRKPALNYRLYTGFRPVPGGAQLTAENLRRILPTFCASRSISRAPGRRLTGRDP